MKITEQAIRDALHPAVSDLQLSQWDKQRMVQVAVASSRRKKRAGLHQLGRVALSLVCVLAISLTSTAVVLASPSLSEKLSWLGRQTRRYLTPVMASSTSSGVEMEVLASMQDEETVVAYLSFADTTGERLADTMELPDIMIDGAPTVISGTPVRQPDGSVVVRVQGLRDPMRAMDGRISISLSTILSGETDTGFVPTGVTLADIQLWNPNPKMGGSLPVSGVDLVGNGSLDNLMEQDTMQILKPVTQYVDERVPFLEFQSAGILDGALHLLARRDLNLWYDQCMLALFDASGSPVAEDSAQVSLGRTRSGSDSAGTEMVEFVLDIPHDTPPEALALYFRTRTYETCITGQWQVDFEVDKSPRPTVQVPSALDMNSWTLTKIKVSPFGVVASGSGVLLEDSYMPRVRLHLTDGTVLEDFSAAITSVQTGMNGQPDQISSKQYFNQPLELEMLERIEVNDTTIWTK